MTQAMPRILLIDDQKVFSDLAKIQLTNRGFSVTVTNNGTEAVSKIRSEKPDAVVLDIQLGNVSGFDVIKTLKSDDALKSIPVIVCSVTVREKKAIQELLALGAEDYIAKPADPDALAARLRNALEKKDAL